MKPTKNASANSPSSPGDRPTFDVERFIFWFFLFLFGCVAISFYRYVVSEAYEVHYGEGEVFEPGFEPE